MLTLAVLVALFVTFAGTGVTSLQKGALLFSTATAMLAVGGMGWDAVDLWVRGRKLMPSTVRLLRSLVFLAVLAAVGSSFLSRTTGPVLVLAPSMVVYLFVARRPPEGAAAGGRRAGAGRQGAPGAARGGAQGSAKARQRRGGKKHK
jgi:hypothetical protein